MFKKLLITSILFFSNQSYGFLGSNKPPKIAKIEVYKHERRMDLLRKRFGQYEVYKSYPIMLGGDPIGHKVQEGDKKTPEGKYIIDYKNPKSRFYLSLHISYPNKADKDYATSLGVSPGGDIMIHGMPNEVFAPEGSQLTKEQIYEILYKRDWTIGCIAVRNDQMKEIYELIKEKTVIEIFP